jgi:hypothetical protein
MKSAFLYRPCFVAVGNKEINKKKQLLPVLKDRMYSKNKSCHYQTSYIKSNGNKAVKFISDITRPFQLAFKRRHLTA